jgi:hypothetical protein
VALLASDHLRLIAVPTIAAVTGEALRLVRGAS